MTPHVLIDPNDAHAFKASRIRQQEFFPIGQYRLVNGMPGHRRVSGNAINGHVVSDQAHKSPAQGPKGELGAWGSRLADVITPGTRTRTTAVTPYIHHQHRGLMPPRFVRQAPGTRPQRIPRAPTPWTQPSRISGTALQDEPAPLAAHPHSHQAQLLQPAIGRHIRSRKGSMRHVGASQRLKCRNLNHRAGPDPMPTPPPHPKMRRAGFLVLTTPHLQNRTRNNTRGGADASWHPPLPHAYASRRAPHTRSQNAEGTPVGDAVTRRGRRPGRCWSAWPVACPGTRPWARTPWHRGSWHHPRWQPWHSERSQPRS